MTNEPRRLIVLPPDWHESSRPPGPRHAVASDRALEETARALCRELQQRAIFAAIKHQK